MLKELFVSNYALIDDLRLPFEDQFTVLTGETGAGKSILLGALGMVLGDRADKSATRNPDKKMVVEASFSIENYNLQSRFEALDLDYANETILRREITPSGKSRSFVNDTPVTLSSLKELTFDLLHIHAQDETHRLLKSGEQIHFLDDFVGDRKIISDFKSNYNHWTTANKERKSFQEKINSAQNKIEFLEFQTREIEKSNILNEEQDINTLERTLSKAENAEFLMQAKHSATNILQNEQSGGIVHLLGLLEQEIKNITQYDANAEGLNERIKSVKIEVEDIHAEIDNTSMQFDVEEVEEMRSKINAYNALLQKHNMTEISELKTYYEEIKNELGALDQSDEQLVELKEKEQKAHDKATESARRLRKQRKKAATYIKEFVEGKLPQLSMPNAEIEMQFEEAELYKHGIDRVQFYFTANKGSSVQPLEKVASGGEKSRLMLILQWMWAKNKKLPTVIFDEIDAGVSGKVAESMGNVMKDLSEHMQVLAITHLPQIAAKGIVHLNAEKTEKNNQTFSSIQVLEENERLNKLAQMLSGHKVTEEAKNNAKQMLASAN